VTAAASPRLTVTSNVRLVVPLDAEARRYAWELGIGIGALIAVALREYLDGRRRVGGGPVPVSPGEAGS
jgi:hypothetical protein